MTTDNKPKMRTHVFFAALFMIFIILDRITKHFAATQIIKGDVTVWDGVLKFHYLENRGAAWGLFENAFWLFYIVTAVVILIMVFMYSKIPFEKRYLFLRFLLVMLCAGAVGNFIDRALYKYVIDFIWIEAINFPVFNVADIYVTVSVLLLVIALLFVYNKDSLFSPKKTNDDLIRKNDPDNTQTDAANQKDENE